MYRYFEITPQEVRLVHEYPKSRYGEYERFATILGKFDPYAMFFVEPSEISVLGYQELQAILRRMGSAQGGEDHEEREE